MPVLHDVLNNSDYMLDLCADKSLTMADQILAGCFSVVARQPKLPIKIKKIWLCKESLVRVRVNFIKKDCNVRTTFKDFRREQKAGGEGVKLAT